MANRNYTEWHTIDYKNEQYIFNPYTFGIGAWAELKPNGEAGKTVEKAIQKELNRFFFGREDLPTLYERFMYANQKEKEVLKEISIGWLQLKVKALQQGTSLPSEIVDSNRQFIKGRMFFYTYDAKTKDKLQIWDKFPLTILIEKDSHSFLGLNLHYLDSNIRLKFLSNLMAGSAYYSKGTNTITLGITYQTLKKTVQYNPYKSCIKRYLISNVMSRILPIEAHEWVYAASLPVANFVENRRK